MSELYELHERPVAAARPRAPLFGGDQGLLIVAALLWAAMTLLKVWLAFQAAVVWEEGHFAVSGLYPALAYPDIPAGWPLFARLCVELFGWSPLAVRLPGLAVAQLIPFAVYFMAVPLVGRRHGLWAAIASLLLPPTAASGPIFYPECALQLLLALMLGCMLRAIASRGRALLWWLLTGLCGGLGLLIHYRMGVAGLGVVLFAALTTRGRRLWREPGFWVAGVIAAAFMAPAVLYNLDRGAPAVSYHVAGRHTFGLQPETLMVFLGMQIALCTPPLFAALAVAAWRVRKAEVARLYLMTAATIFLLYAGLALMSSRSMPQWPFMAYVPLLAFVPGVTIEFVDAARTQGARLLRSAVAWSTPVFTAAAFALATAVVTGYRVSADAPLAALALLPARFEDWRPLEPVLAEASALARAGFGGEPAMVTAGHTHAVKLEFQGPRSRRVYTLDEPNDLVTRFNVQRADMSLDAAALSRVAAGRPVVVVMPEPTFLYHTPEETAFRAAACGRFEDLRLFRVVEPPPAKSAIEIYVGRVAARPGPPRRCALLPALYVAQPKRGEVIRSGEPVNLFGMAADPRGVARIEVRSGGRLLTTARLHLDPPGSRAPAVLNDDPDWPRVQFDYQLPRLPRGVHRIETIALAPGGAVVGRDVRTVYVDP